MKQFIRPPGHDKCSASSGICEHYTFGSGKLDSYGYWEIPCNECAREFEKQFPQEGPCWPFTEEQLKEFTKQREKAAKKYSSYVHEIFNKK